MLIKITLYNGTVYRFADRTRDTSDGLYLGRIADDVALTSRASEAGAAPQTVNVSIDNSDSLVAVSDNFWGARCLITQDDGTVWSGTVDYYCHNSDGTLDLTISDKGAPEFQRQIPDEVRQVYTIDDSFHQSSVTMTIPLAIGGSHSSPLFLPTILIDKTQGIYLICVGEIREIVKVYKGTEALPATAYTAYRGTTSQTSHPGFAYVQLAEDYRLNDDGSYADITVDIVGLKLGTHTEAECRNGARFLYWFLKTPATGIGGWGCGIDTSEIDTQSFDNAIIVVDSMNLKLDGVMWFRQTAESWIDQICQAIHGTYQMGADGKRRLKIDYAGANSRKTFDKFNCMPSMYGKNSFTDVYNKGILSYGYNCETGEYMQSAQFENAGSIAQIGEQKFVGESYLINDAATALKVLEYTCKRSLSFAEAVRFSTDDLDADLSAGDVITMDIPELGLSGLYQIDSISTNSGRAEISAGRFDPSVFTVTGSHDNIDWGDEKQIISSVNPGEPTGLTLSTSYTITEDGQAGVYIDGSFILPASDWLFASVSYGEGAAPTSWAEHGLVRDTNFRITGVKPAAIYTVRVRLMTATGHSDYVTATITTAGDTVAPTSPTVTASTYLKTIRVQASIVNPPPDLAGFEIWRSNISGEHGTRIGYVSATRGSGTYVDIDAADYMTNFYYSARAIDNWGNISAYSAQAVANCSSIQVHDVTADWIMANVFETAHNVGPDVDGVRFDADGIEGWLDGVAVFDLNKNTESTIGGWHIGAHRLYSNNIEMSSDGQLKTIDYISGHRGWFIGKEGNAEFQDATIRGTMTTVNFVKDTVSAVGGSLMILGAAEVQDFTKTTQNTQNLLCEDYIDLAAEDGSTLVMEQSGTSIYYSITVDDSSTFNGGDILRIRNAETVQDLWLGMVSKTADTLYCVMQYGVSMDLESGMCIVNYRRAGNGGILLNGNVPLMDMFTHSGRPWEGTDCWIRMGNIKGINSITDDRFGIFIGDSNASHSGRHFLQYDEKSGKLQVQGEVIITSGSTYNNISNAQTTANTANTNANAALTFRNAVANSDYTSIKGGVIKTGIIKSTGFSGVTDGSAFSSAGMAINLDNSTLTAKGIRWNSAGDVAVDGDLLSNSDGSYIFPDTYTTKNAYGNAKVMCSHYGPYGNVFSMSNCVLNIEQGWTKQSLAIYFNVISANTSGAEIYMDVGDFDGDNSSYTYYTVILMFKIVEGGDITSKFINPRLSYGTFVSSEWRNLGNSRYMLIAKFTTTSNANNFYLGVTQAAVGVKGFIEYYNYIVGKDRHYVPYEIPFQKYNYDSGAGRYYADPNIFFAGPNIYNTTNHMAVRNLYSFYVRSPNARFLTVWAQTYNNSSDERLKTNIKDASTLDVLRKLRVKRWEFKSDLGNEHIGPMAKDFNEAFRVNRGSLEGITTTDLAGVALRAIQELAAKVDELEARLCQTGY